MHYFIRPRVESDYAKNGYSPIFRPNILAGRILANSIPKDKLVRIQDRMTKIDQRRALLGA